MAIKHIIKYPDKILKTESKITLDRSDLEDQDIGGIMLLGLEKHWKDAEDTLINSEHGAALAAAQIGILERWFITNQQLTGNIKNTDKVRAIPSLIINPRIITHGSGKINEKEGCLSFPNFSTYVSRWNEICVCYSTILNWGSSQSKKWIDIEETYDGFWARVFQHEIDHLDGKLFIDSLPYSKRLQIAKNMETNK